MADFAFRKELFLASNPGAISSRIAGGRFTEGERTYGRMWRLMHRWGADGMKYGATAGSAAGLVTGVFAGIVLSTLVDGGLSSPAWFGAGVVAGGALGTLVGGIVGYTVGAGLGLAEATFTNH